MGRRRHSDDDDDVEDDDSQMSETQSSGAADKNERHWQTLSYEPMKKVQTDGV